MIDLQEIKQNYLNSANQIPNWKSIPKKELANKYLEYRDTNPTLANSYISCLIVTYWPLLISFQQSCGTSQIDNAIAYNWLIDAIGKLFKYRPWLDPTTKIYDDERAIDKAMYTYMQSSRTNELVANSLQKRRLNINCYSTDELNEENSSGVYTASNENLTIDVSIHGLVQCFIDDNDIVYALIIDIICYQISFYNGKYNNNLVYQVIRNIDEDYYDYFTKTYFVKYIKDKIVALRDNKLIKEFYDRD